MAALADFLLRENCFIKVHLLFRVCERAAGSGKPPSPHPPFVGSSWDCTPGVHADLWYLWCGRNAITIISLWLIRLSPFLSFPPPPPFSVIVFGKSGRRGRTTTATSPLRDARPDTGRVGRPGLFPRAPHVQRHPDVACLRPPQRPPQGVGCLRARLGAGKPGARQPVDPGTAKAALQKFGLTLFFKK